MKQNNMDDTKMKSIKQSNGRLDALNNNKDRIEKALSLQSDSMRMRQGNISLILDSYEDIFSDFDPRHYSEKALSDDFLTECKRASRDKTDDGIEIRLLIPKEKRKPGEENIIKRRINDHFQKHFAEKQKELKRYRIEGLMWFLAGAALILTATAIYEHQGESFAYDFFFVILEPAGWFTIWTGLEKLFLDPKQKAQDYDFYHKMSHSEIIFNSY